MKGVGNQVSFLQECFKFINRAPLSKNGAINDKNGRIEDFTLLGNCSTEYEVQGV